MELTLKQICSIYATDKNCLHSYVDEVYENLFKDIRYSAKKILELGVDNGSSIMMWKEYFEKADITGIDNKDCPQLQNRDRIQFLSADAYDYKILDQLPNDFDVIIEDGPHTLETITFVATEYVKKIKDNGIVIIEDFQDFNWINIINRLLPKEFKSETKDLRNVRNRYDDILMIITKA